MSQNTYPYQSKISIADYNYDLPENKIARYPLEKRHMSKLLIYQDGTISGTVFSDLSNNLDKNSLLVINNTKVIHSRLFFTKPTGAIIEIFCLEPYDPSDYLFALQATHTCKWKCFAGNLKKWKEGILSKEIDTLSGKIILEALKFENKDNYLIVEFRWNGDITFAQILELTGETPIPPYLNRKSEEIDKERYQTVYSEIDGSVAAPTAGLHFTPEVFGQLQSRNISFADVTLHVGAGTFKPVQTEKAEDHEMHSEFFSVSKQTLEKLRDSKQIVAVGTTSLRTLESLYWLALKIRNNHPFKGIPELKQWDAYRIDATLQYNEAIDVILGYINSQKLDAFAAKTQLMVLPGYDIKSANALITNFHQPKSTLLLLVSAFIGADWKKVYTYALENNFRFLSYGDSSLLFRSTGS